MKVNRLALSLITCALLVGCSSSSSVNSNHLSADEISAELAEFRRLKPSLQRLVASETELKELIVTLDQLANADNPDYQSDIQSPHNNTQVEVLDKQVFHETLEPPAVIKPESNAMALVSQVNPASEQAQQKTESLGVPQVTAVNTETVAAIVDVGKDVQVTAEFKADTNTAAVPQSELIPEVAETVKLQQRYALQLASVVNPNQLVSTWTQMQRRHSSILSGMEPLYEKYQKGNTTFYRLKAMGTLTVADARSACSSIVGQGGQCFIGSNNGVKNVADL
ncbi:SPOR domain-containing protein [Rheinheimera sediminis]|uniref:SPOR domain-containing protein n=1 Tax=Rheinheimera sp. YQF-1 TaxID=2499626 RepID=UPI00164552B8|nr:SPOR domain-containing protein [Rheinheimera sp. YQF-1]